MKMHLLLTEAINGHFGQPHVCAGRKSKPLPGNNEVHLKLDKIRGTNSQQRSLQCSDRCACALTFEKVCQAFSSDNTGRFYTFSKVRLYSYFK